MMSVIPVDSYRQKVTAANWLCTRVYFGVFAHVSAVILKVVLCLRVVSISEATLVTSCRFILFSINLYVEQSVCVFL